MRKITTLFKKDPADLGRVINEVSPENAWALDPTVPATRKYDGTACVIIDGELYKRYDAKHGKPAPVGGIPCQEPDGATGHWPHWVKCDRENKADKWAFEAFDLYVVVAEELNRPVTDGTFELIGPKVQKNAENVEDHHLIQHGLVKLNVGRDFDAIRDYLTEHDMEGIVFHHPDGRMCKIRKSDFGIKREVPAPQPA